MPEAVLARGFGQARAGGDHHDALQGFAQVRGHGMQRVLQGFAAAQRQQDALRLRQNEAQPCQRLRGKRQRYTRLDFDAGDVRTTHPQRRGERIATAGVEA